MRRTVLLALIVAAGWLAVVSLGAEEPKREFDDVPAARVQAGAAVTSTRLNRARRIAKRYWHFHQCGHVTMRRGRLPRPTIARASWVRQGGHSRNCRVMINSLHRRLAFRQYCAAIVHEYGHLAGYPHSPNPRSVMYPVITRYNIPKSCKQRRDRRL